MSSRTILCTALFLTPTLFLASAASAAPGQPAAAEALRTPDGGGERGFLGVSVQDSEEGVQVSEVQPGGGAAAAGIQDGDLLVAIGDQEIESFADLRRELDRHQAGQSIPVTVRRGEEELHLDVLLAGRREPVDGGRLLERTRSATLQDLMRRREEFERSWRQELDAELQRMRERFEEGSGRLADELRESLDDEGQRAPEVEGMKRDLERWKGERLRALERMRAALPGMRGEERHERHESHEDGDEPKVYFWSPDGDELRLGGWAEGWSKGWPGWHAAQQMPPMAFQRHGPDLDGLRESVDDLRAEVQRLRSEIDELRSQRSRTR